MPTANPWLALAAVLVVLYAPALVLLPALRGGLRPVDVVAAPGVSVIAVSVAGLALAELGSGPSPELVAALIVGAALLSAALRWAVLRLAARRRADDAPPPQPRRARDAWRRRDLLLAAAGVGLSLALGLVFWMTPDWLEGVPNTVDSIWHGYTTGLLASGTPASPFTLVPVDPYLATPTTPYPYGFHLVAALATSAAGAVPAVNSVLYAGALVAGPIGAAGAARVIFPRLPAAALIAPVVLQSFAMWQIRVQAQPPYALGMALLPGGIALVAAALRKGWAPSSVAVAVAYGAGMLVVHPASAVSLAVVVLPLVVVDLAGRLRRGARPRARSLLRVWPVLVTAALVLPWILRSLSSAGLALAVPRVLVVPVEVGLRQAVLLSDGILDAPVWLLVLVALSLVWIAVRGPARWLLASWALLVALTVVAASGSGSLRLTLTGPWFMDAHRMWSVIAVIDALVVAGAVAGAAQLLLASLRPRVRPWAVGGLVAAMCAALLSVALVQGPPYRVNTASARGELLVTHDEQAAFAWLRAHLAPGDRVLNNWRDGSTWGFAIEGNPILVPYLSTTVLMRDRARLMVNMDKLGTDPRVDDLVVALNARWAIVDSTGLPGGQPPDAWFPADTPYATLEWQQGGTSIYRLDLEALRATPAP